MGARRAGSGFGARDLMCSGREPTTLIRVACHNLYNRWNDPQTLAHFRRFPIFLSLLILALARMFPCRSLSSPSRAGGAIRSPPPLRQRLPVDAGGGTVAPRTPSRSTGPEANRSWSAGGGRGRGVLSLSPSRGRRATWQGG